MKQTDRQKAKQLYIDSKGTMPLIDIANQIKRPPGTVRGWKSKDDWDGALHGTFQDETERSEQAERSTNRETIKKEVKEIKQIVSNEDLTEKQQLFCIYYLKYFNATKAYQKAFGSAYTTAMVEGSRLLKRTSVAAEIERIKAERMQELHIESTDIMQKYIDIAFADITDYVEFGTQEIVAMNDMGVPLMDSDGNEVIYKVSFVNILDNSEVDGTILSEVSKGKDGVKVKLNDKMKALEWLSKNLPNYRYGLELELLERRVEKEKISIQKLEAEVKILTDTNESSTENKVGDLLEGLLDEVDEETETSI